MDNHWTWNQFELEKSVNFTIKQLNKFYHDIYEAYKEEVNMLNEGNEDVRCPFYFDRILFWPNTKEDQNITQSCPPFPIKYYSNSMIEKLAVHLNVTESCQKNGSWYPDLRKQDRMRAPNYAFYMLDSTDEWKYSWDLAGLLLVKDLFPTIASISYIGYSITFAATILAMMVFCSFKKLRNPTNKLHMHLFATFIVKAFMMLLKYSTYSPESPDSFWNIDEYLLTFRNPAAIFYEDNVGSSAVGYQRYSKGRKHCRYIRILWNYLILANYSWMLMEGLYLCKLILLPMNVNTSRIRFILLGWGLPCLVTIMWITIHATIANSPCWSIYDHPSLFRFITIPITTSVLINFSLFLYIVYILYVKFRTSRQLQRRRMQYRKWVKSTVVLMPLFGVHYFIFMGLSYCENETAKIVSVFFYQFFTSFQGAFVAILYCLLNDEVRTEVCRAWRTHWSKFSYLLRHRRLSNRQRREGNQARRPPENRSDNNVADIPMMELSPTEVS